MPLMAFLAQVRLLLWKNSLLQRRKICASVFEIIFPTLFAAIVVIIRVVAKPEHINDPTYYGRESIVNNVFDNDGFRVEIGYTPNYPCLEPIMSKVATDFAQNNYNVDNGKTVYFLYNDLSQYHFVCLSQVSYMSNTVFYFSFWLLVLKYHVRLTLYFVSVVDFLFSSIMYV